MTIIAIGSCVPGAVLSVLFIISLNLHSEGGAAISSHFTGEEIES